MTKFKSTFVFIFIALLSLIPAVHASNWIEVQTLDGKYTTLSQHFEEGKWTLVMLWTSNCGICVREYPVMSEFHDKHKDVDAKVIGVSLDGYSQLTKIKNHINDMPITFDNFIGDITTVAFNYQNSTEEPLQDV